jgi:hypothetical protein
MAGPFALLRWPSGADQGPKASIAVIRDQEPSALVSWTRMRWYPAPAVRLQHAVEIAQLQAGARLY